MDHFPPYSGRDNIAYKYQRARTSRVGLVHEDQDALRLPRGRLGSLVRPCHLDRNAFSHARPEVACRYWTGRVALKKPRAETLCRRPERMGRGAPARQPGQPWRAGRWHATAGRAGCASEGAAHHLVTTTTGARVTRICRRTPASAKPIITTAQARRQSAVNRLIRSPHRRARAGSVEFRG
jgi:hypothetical protein